MRNPRDFFKPLAIDAPEPAREIPFKPSRMIHFLDFSNEKMVAKLPETIPAKIERHFKCWWMRQNNITKRFKNSLRQ